VWGSAPLLEGSHATTLIALWIVTAIVLVAVLVVVVVCLVRHRRKRRQHAEALRGHPLAPASTISMTNATWGARDGNTVGSQQASPPPPATLQSNVSVFDTVFSAAAAGRSFDTISARTPDVTSARAYTGSPAPPTHAPTLVRFDIVSAQPVVGNAGSVVAQAPAFI
jgi:hypothetical protein